MKTVFEKIEQPEKHVSKSINMDQSIWDKLEAYRQYGCERKGFEITTNSLLKEIIDLIIEKDKEFDKTKWLKKTKG